MSFKHPFFLTSDLETTNIVTDSRILTFAVDSSKQKSEIIESET